MPGASVNSSLPAFRCLDSGSLAEVARELGARFALKPELLSKLSQTSGMVAHWHSIATYSLSRLNDISRVGHFAACLSSSEITQPTWGLEVTSWLNWFPATVTVWKLA